MRIVVIVAMVAWLAWLACSAALAGPALGVAVPLPEVLAPSTYDIDISIHGTQMLQAAEAQQHLGVQVGLPYGFEVGIDTRLGGPSEAWPSAAWRNWELGYNPDAEGWTDVWINVKKQVIPETDKWPAIAIGLIGIGSKESSSFWGTAGKHFGDFNLCLGWADAFGISCYYELIGYQPSPDWRFIAEHTGGSTMSTNFAVEHPLNENLTGSLGFMRANDSLHDHALFAKLTYHGSWLKPDPEDE